MFSTTRMFLAGLLFAFASPSLAQVKIYVAATAPDSVGARLAYALKEGIRRSASMSLADRKQDGALWVIFVTLDPDKSQGGSDRTIYSAVWTMQTFHDVPVTMYLSSTVGLCGSKRVQECADSLAAETDEQVSIVRSWVQSALEQEKK
jgi:hypothetical protein